MLTHELAQIIPFPLHLDWLMEVSLLIQLIHLFHLIIYLPNKFVVSITSNCFDPDYLHSCIVYIQGLTHLWIVLRYCSTTLQSLFPSRFDLSTLVTFVFSLQNQRLFAISLLHFTIFQCRMHSALILFLYYSFTKVYTSVSLYYAYIKSI